MTASWADLFERAAAHEVTLDRVRAAREAGPDGPHETEAGGDEPGGGATDDE